MGDNHGRFSKVVEYFIYGNAAKSLRLLREAPKKVLFLMAWPLSGEGEGVG